MRYRAAQRLSPRDFFGGVSGTRFAIVLLGSGLRLRFNPEIIQHFEEAYPRQFTFGILDRTRVQHDLWWQDNFRTSFGPIKRGGEAPEDGYYLFEVGAVSAHISPPKYLDEKAEAKQVAAYFDQRVSLRAAQEPRTARESDPEPLQTIAPASSDPDPFAVLGVDHEASDDEIRAAYKEQMKLNHPDKVAHLSPAIRKVAEQQTVVIQQAYAAIRRMRKGSL